MSHSGCLMKCIFLLANHLDFSLKTDTWTLRHAKRKKKQREGYDGEHETRKNKFGPSDDLFDTIMCRKQVDTYSYESEIM